MPAPESFSLAEAKAALETVRARLVSLQGVQRRLRELREELQGLARRHLNNGVVAEQRVRQLRQLQHGLGEEAQQHASAIRSAGAELKSIEDGLVDFPTEIEGVPAYWCWRAGEDDIRWWHPRSTGFAGRQPIEG